MFPDYRRTAEQRQEKAMQAIVVFACIGSICIMGTVYYVLAHFIMKFW